LDSCSSPHGKSAAPLRAIAVLAAIAWGSPSLALGQPVAWGYDPTWHGGIATAALAAVSLLELTDRGEIPPCRWCGIGSDGAVHVNRADQWARSHWRWRDEARADRLSDVTAGAALAWPMVGLLAVHRGARGEWGRDQIVAAESIAVSMAASRVIKRALRRPRPGVVFDREPVDEPNDVHAFVSGHAASTFAAAVSAGAISSRRSSDHARWIWMTGIGLATSTSYLRVAADRHYLTDVLGGAAVGATVGWLMPHLFEDRRAGPLSPNVTSELTGMGPALRLGLGRTNDLALQLGAGTSGLGLVASVRIP
jgi:hypothetical protein